MDSIFDFAPPLYAPLPIRDPSPLLFPTFDDLHLLDIPFQPSLVPTFPTPSELLADLTANPPTPTGSDDLSSDSRVDTARKARRREMATTIGFVPTDPDTISSHEKKRHYLECLEQYILFLHEQFQLLGEASPRMEKTESYRGLSSRSIRTLLVHMRHTARNLNETTVSEEQRFSDLRNQVLSR